MVLKRSNARVRSCDRGTRPQPQPSVRDEKAASQARIAARGDGVDLGPEPTPLARKGLGGASGSINFSVVGSSFFAKMLCSGGSGEAGGGGGPPGLDRGGHGPATGQGDPPAARARDFGDESVRMETAKQPSDLARLPVFVWCEGIRSTPQLLSHVAVRETV